MKPIIPLLLLFAVIQAAPSAASAEAPKSEGLSVETKHKLVKAHGILMVTAWLFLIPSAILFARMVKDAFKDHKPFGLSIWFHVHRTFNIIAIILMAISFLLIFIVTNWKWKGIFSTSKTSTQLHTTTGVIAFALAIAQPFLALLRCDPSDSRRRIFNWIHRLLGLIAFVCAMVALVVAATEFKKLWTEPELQTILMVIPALLLVVLWPLTTLLLPREEEKKNKNETESFLGMKTPKRRNTEIKGYSLRLSICFWGCGMMLATVIALSLLIATGYKPKPSP